MALRCIVFDLVDSAVLPVLSGTAYWGERKGWKASEVGLGEMPLVMVYIDVWAIFSGTRVKAARHWMRP